MIDLESQLPSEICAEDHKSFAAYTLRQRLPHIVEQIIQYNSYSSRLIAELQHLMGEITSGVIEPLKKTGYVDSKIWTDCIRLHLGKSWFTAPFLFVEMYFYRRIAETIGILDAANTENCDPFRQQKRRSFDEALVPARSLAVWLESTRNHLPQEDITDKLHQILLANLWSNCADLSQLPKGKSTDKILGKPNYLLMDDSDAIASLITHSSEPLDRIDIVLDNTGIELISDLALADFLISTNLFSQVVLHAKSQPVFVSDVMKHDVLFTICSLISSEIDELKQWGKHLEHLVDSKAIAIRDHYCWTLPLDFRSMTTELLSELNNSRLLISKGDANYRRLVGDRHWNINTSIRQVVDYLPFPCVALRVLKSEVLVGMDGDRLQQFDLDTDWMINGTYGIIQFNPAS